MDLVYSSDQYTVVEFHPHDDHEALQFGGYEIMDNTGQREFFIDGVAAELFRQQVSTLISSSPSMEEIDNFLSKYDVMMSHPMTKH